jgi:ATP-dependent RNA helicase DeaD
MNFKNLGIDEDIINVLKNNGITSPTIVQEKCFGIINEGSDLITKAQTGTGKTLAFLLPIFENISPTSKDIQALILTPTRELAIQITDEAMKLKKAKDLNILSAYGGKDISAQIRKLKGNIHIIIDEADQMLLMGFKKEVENIISHTPKARQTLCFSATIDSQVKKLAYKYMNDPINISIQNDNVTLDNIVQQVVETTDRNKQDALFNVIDEDRPFMAIIFCRTKIRVDKLEESMHSKGYNCKKLHSDILQSKREKVMKSFRSGDIQYLIATDVASRGLDISGVDHIYNYDMPENAESYIHRIGRTGRAGENGYTCLFTAKKDMEILSEIESHIGFKIERRNINI